MIKSKSLLTLFTLMFFFAVSIPIIAIIFSLNNIYTNSLVTNLSKKALENTEQISFYLDDTLQKINVSLENICYSGNSKILNSLTSYKKLFIATKENSKVKEIDEEIDKLINYYDCVEAIVFFYKNSGYYYYKNRLICGDFVIRDTYWYKNCLREPRRVISSRIPSEALSSDERKFYTVFSLNVPYAGDIEVVSIILNDKLFNNIYDKLSEFDSGKIIISEKGNIISENLLGEKRASLPQGLLVELSSKHNGYYVERSKTDKIISYSHVKDGDWVIINSWSLDSLKGDNNQILLLFIKILLLLFLILFLIILLFLKKILAPVRELTKAMKSVKDGNFDIDLKEKWGSIEFDSLAHTFKHMAFEIKNLISDIDKKETMKRKLEIQALQYQFNPHFIKNSLNSIRLMAILNDIPDIKNMTTCLSNIISSTIEDDSLFTTVKNEFKLLYDFIYIMQIRYQHMFTVEYDLKEDIMEYSILRNTLQPVVENAIFHGVGSGREMGEIKICGYKSNGKLIFTVFDNGNGMSEETLENLRNKIKTGKSIGLLNIMNRLELNYGKEYGLRFESVPKKYTKVSIFMPVKLYEKEKNDV